MRGAPQSAADTGDHVVQCRIVEPIPDEPPFYLAAASATSDGVAYSGTAADTSLDTAVARATWECRERASFGGAAVAARTRAILATVGEVQGSSIDLAQACSVEPIGSDTQLNWLPCHSLLSGRSSLVPAQAIGFGTMLGDSAIVQDPTTSGTAAHSSPDQASLNAVLELVERDAFMRAFFGVTRATRVQIGIAEVELVKRYGLDATFLNLPCQANQEVILCVLEDQSGVGPAVTSGMGIARHGERAALRALLEAWQPRVWIRAEMFRVGHNEQSDRIRTPLDRGLFWSHVERLAAVRSALEAMEVGPWVVVDGEAHQSPGRALASLLASLSERGHELFEYQLERGVGYSAVRAIAPSLYSLFLDERHAYTPRVPRPYQGLPSPHFFL